MAQKLDTSISDTRARAFLRDAEERETLWCDRVTGFHLIKLKRGGSWRYKYMDDNGKRRVATVGKYPSMKPQQAAERALEWRQDDVDVLAEKERRRREAKQEAERAEKRTIRRYLEDTYKKYQERKRTGPETLQRIRRHFSDWLDRDMASLSRADLLEWQARMEGEGLAHNSVRRSYSALKTMLRHATRQDPPVIHEDPLDNVQLEPPTDAERAATLSADKAATRRMLTPDEVQKLYDGLEGLAEEVRTQRRGSRYRGKSHLPDLDAVAFPHWFIPFCYCALYTGLRPGDLVTLTWLEANARFGRLNKVMEKTKHHSKPARVVMDMTTELQEVLLQWWKQQGEPTDGFVFPSPVTGRKLDRQGYRRTWVRVKRHGGLPDDLDFYSLRHHFISTLVSAGVPLLTVAQLAGHKSVSMIEEHYGHLCPDAASEAMAAFSRSVARKKGSSNDSSALGSG